MIVCNMWCLPLGGGRPLCFYISWGHRVSCQHGAFSGVGAFVASFAPAECPKAEGYVGHIRKALEKGYLEHPGLHAVLTTCLRFSSLLDSVCAACCLFLSTGSYYVCIQIHTTCCCFPRCTTTTFGAQKGSLWGCRVGAYDSLSCQVGREASYSRFTATCMLS